MNVVIVMEHQITTHYQLLYNCTNNILLNTSTVLRTKYNKPSDLIDNSIIIVNASPPLRLSKQKHYNTK